MASAVTVGLDSVSSARGAGRLREQSRVLWLVAMSPAKGFSAIAERPSWLLVFLLVFSLNAAYSVPMLPLVTQAALGEAAARMNPATGDSEARISGQVRAGQMVGIVVSPAFLLAKWFGVAVAFWAAVTIIGGSVSLRAMFSLAAHANLPLIIGYFVGIQMMILRGPGGITGLTDLRPRLGLNAVMPGATPAADVWLGSVSPPDIWFVFLLIIGLERVAQLPRRLAVVLAAGYWLVSVALQARFATLTG